jgi:CO dehydrogenase/acetyl-CoA synthase beta subunit
MHATDTCKGDLTVSTYIANFTGLGYANRGYNLMAVVALLYSVCLAIQLGGPV